VEFGMGLCRREVLGEKERHSLIAVPGHQVGGAEQGPSLRHEAGFLSQLAPCRRRNLLPRFVERPRRDLPQLAAGHIAELADENDAPGGIPRDDADRTWVSYDLPCCPLATGQPHAVTVYLEEF